MKSTLKNYQKIKKLLYLAKQTFLSDKGMEIMPSLENLEVFRQELRKIIDLVDELGYDIQSKDDKLYDYCSKQMDAMFEDLEKNGKLKEQDLESIDKELDKLERV